MDVTDDDIENIRRISERQFGDSEYLELVEVKDTSGDVMVQVEATDHDMNAPARNAFAGGRLRHYHEQGYMAVAVAGGDDRHSAWFERAEAVEFGDPKPDGEYHLVENWHAVVGSDYVVLKNGGETVAHVKRDGWDLDNYVLHYVLPPNVTQSLLDIGFEKSEDVDPDNE